MVKCSIPKDEESSDKPLDQRYIDTEKLEKSVNKRVSIHESTCPYAREKSGFVNTKEIFKFGLFIAPFAVSFFVWVSSLNTRISVLEENSKIIKEIREDLKEMNKSITEIKIKLAGIKQ